MQISHTSGKYEEQNGLFRNKIGERDGHKEAIDRFKNVIL